MPLPPIYCLTLAEEPHKRAALESDLTAQSIDATYLPGFYGATLGIKSINPFTHNLNGTPEYIHANTLGCYLSHLMALRVALTYPDDESFIILEEDAKLCDAFPERFDELISSLPADINLLNLELFDTDLAKPSEPVSHLATRLFWPFGAAGIWWRRDAAEIAIRHLHPISEPYDIALMTRVYPFCTIASARPSLVQQRSACGTWPSSIHSAVQDAP